jgi:hypothetical protein
MNKKNTILYAGFGLWVSGMLVGANAVDLLPDEPSWPSGVILAVGLLTSLGSARLLYRTFRYTGSQ